MSYNTRRTGVGRGTPATQVNYHQQPNRAQGGNTGLQNRTNPGYSTSQPPVTYNSAAQPAFSTKPPLAASQPKPAPPPQPQQPAPPAPPNTPAMKQPVTPANTPVLKQEPVTPADTTEKMETTENGDSSGPKTPFWKKRPFVKVSNKVRRARQNAKLRRLLNPKNALTFLNELRPGTGKFIVREEPGWGYVATVEVDKKTFSGRGLSTSKAKVQASEKALKHLLLEQLARSQEAAAAAETKEEPGEDEPMPESEQEGEEPKAKKAKTLPEDDVPWGSLAAFALHKLFTEWQKEGPVDAPVAQVFPTEKYDEEIDEEPYFSRRPPGPPEYGYHGRSYAPYPTRGRGFAPYPSPRGPPGPPPHGFGLPPPGRRIPPPTAPSAASFAPGPRPQLPGGAAPMKKIPEDANQRHPVMLLNQLKPNVIYNESREGELPRVTFVITIEIDGKQYIGRGKNKKEAKKQAAKAALVPMGIIYSGED